MKPVVQTETFSAGFHGLRDREAKARINSRIGRLRLGNPGDVRSVGDGVSELRRLAGGDKSTQARDIETAKALRKELQEGDNA